MFNWIPMQIIHMALKIQVIPDLMLPKASLPDTAFSAFPLGITQFGETVPIIVITSAYLSFNDSPTSPGIIILRRQGPDRMKMIG